MADYEQIMTALRNAHAAGDDAAARRLAAMAQAARNDQPQENSQQSERSIGEALYENIIGRGEVDTAGERFGQNVGRVLRDVGRSAISGITQAVTSAADAPAAIMGAMGQGAESAIQGGLRLMDIEPPAATNYISEALQAGPFQQQAASRGAEAVGAGGILNYQPETTAGEYAQTIGEFLPFARLGTAGRGASLASDAFRYAVAPAVVSEAAGQLTEDTALEPFARLAGGLLGTRAGEVIDDLVRTTGRASGIREFASRAPSIESLADDANALYNEARQAGAIAPRSSVNQFASATRSLLQNEGAVLPSGRVQNLPKIQNVVNILDEYSAQNMNPTQMLAVRRTISDAASSADPAERRLGSMLLSRFDDFTNQFAPQIREANQIYARMKRGELIEKTIERARARAEQFSGSGLENALRTEFRALDRQIINGTLRVSPEERQLIEAISRGTDLSNLLRNLGRFAPTSAVGAAGGIGLPAYLGTLVGGPAVGIGAAIGAAGTSLAGRRGAQAMQESLSGLLSAGTRTGNIPAELMPQVRDPRAILRTLPAYSGLLSQ